MSYNGSGVYSLPGAPLVNGEVVSASENNTLRNDMATAFNTAWTRDGQAPATANIPMNSHKFTGLAAGTTSGDSVRYEQLADLSLATLQIAYPVGSVYINAGASTNPATLFGFGTWIAFGTGRVLVGIDGSDASFDTLGETGGSKDAIVVSHNHTATSTSTSSVTDSGHVHGSPTGGGYVCDGGTGTNLFAPYGGDLAFKKNGTNTASATTGVSVSTSTSTTVASNGSSGTNANLQPYVVVYMWQRTA